MIRLSGCVIITAPIPILSNILCSQELITINESVDESAGSVHCYIIQTPAATYYLEKEGLGLSSMVDRDGIDWISFYPKDDSRAFGEARGFPNAVHKQDGSFFHFSS